MDEVPFERSKDDEDEEENEEEASVDDSVLGVGEEDEAESVVVVSSADGDVIDMAELVAGTKDTPFNPKLIRIPSFSNSLCSRLSVLQIKTDLTKSGSAVCRYRVNLHMLILNTIWRILANGNSCHDMVLVVVVLIRLLQLKLELLTSVTVGRWMLLAIDDGCRDEDGGDEV